MIAKDIKMKSAAEYKDFGNIVFGDKDYMRAISIYSQGIEICDSTDIDLLSKLYSNRSAAFLEDGDAEKALQDANFILTINGSWAKAHYRRGMALFKLGRLEMCKEALEYAAQIDSRSHEIRNALLDVDLKIKLTVGKAYIKNVPAKDLQPKQKTPDTVVSYGSSEYFKGDHMPWECQICFELYDNKKNRPVVLLCGDTCCLHHIDIQGKDGVVCFICKHPVTRSNDLVVNKELINAGMKHARQSEKFSMSAKMNPKKVDNKVHKTSDQKFLENEMSLIPIYVIRMIEDCGGGPAVWSSIDSRRTESTRARRVQFRRDVEVAFTEAQLCKNKHCAGDCNQCDKFVHDWHRQRIALTKKGKPVVGLWQSVLEHCAMSGCEEESDCPLRSRIANYTGNNPRFNHEDTMPDDRSDCAFDFSITGTADDLLYVSSTSGGLGLSRVSDTAQLDKFSMLRRTDSAGASSRTEGSSEDTHRSTRRQILTSECFISGSFPWECSVCENMYNKSSHVPVTLPCAHTCCRSHTTIKACVFCGTSVHITSNLPLNSDLVEAALLHSEVTLLFREQFRVGEIGVRGDAFVDDELSLLPPGVLKLVEKLHGFESLLVFDSAAHRQSLSARRCQFRKRLEPLILIAINEYEQAIELNPNAEQSLNGTVDMNRLTLALTSISRCILKSKVSAAAKVMIVKYTVTPRAVYYAKFLSASLAEYRKLDKIFEELMWRIF